jgi:hypothetical protein
MTLTLLILLLTLALSFLTVIPEILTLVSGYLSLIWLPKFKISAATTSADFESCLATCTIISAGVLQIKGFK